MIRDENGHIFLSNNDGNGRAIKDSRRGFFEIFMIAEAMKQMSQRNDANHLAIKMTGIMLSNQ